jgi:hypothetical protein
MSGSPICFMRAEHLIGQRLVERDVLARLVVIGAHLVQPELAILEAELVDRFAVRSVGCTILPSASRVSFTARPRPASSLWNSPCETARATDLRWLSVTSGTSVENGVCSAASRSALTVASRRLSARLKPGVIRATLAPDARAWRRRGPRPRAT